MPEDAPQAPSWQDTNEVARDLHRALASPSAPLVPRSHTADETRLPSHYRIAPSVGTASDNAQPGGFRRAHLRLALGTLPEYASQPLTAHLSSKRWAVVLQLADGTEVQYKSRGYRRGLGPTVLHLPDGSAPPPPPPSVCLLWRPRSISYWCSLSYLLGAILFVEGSVAWMVPAWGDAERGAPPDTAHALVEWPYFWGSLLFGAGCYLSFVEVINANLEQEVLNEEELQRDGLQPLQPQPQPQPQPPQGQGRGRSEALLEGLLGQPSLAASPRLAASPGGGREPPLVRRASRDLSHQSLPSREGGGRRSSADSAAGCVEWLRSLAWWEAQLGSLLWWAVLVQLVGGVLFAVSCYAGLPGGSAGLPAPAGWHAQLWCYVPCFAGSVCFVFASAVFVAEASVEPRSLGASIARLNLAGSALFLLASAGYFLAEPPSSPLPAQARFPASEGLVRLPFAVGSACFLVSALLALAELLVVDAERTPER